MYKTSLAQYKFLEYAQEGWLNETPSGDCRSITADGVEYKVDRRKVPSSKSGAMKPLDGRRV